MSIPRPLLCALLVIGTGQFLCGQTLLLPKPNSPLPEFELATIKPTAVPYIGIYTKQGGRISVGHCSILCLGREAFHAQDFAIYGLPAWSKSTEFDIEAVPPEQSPAHRYKPPRINSPKTDDQRLILQALLRDRFAFRYHVAKIEQPVFFIERSGKPLKLKSPKDPTASPS
jgi:uncharacterized protein (TIGR03435 family)